MTMTTQSLVLPLDRMGQGERGVVEQIQGVTEQVHRLRELGLRDGARVEMLRAGTPCIIRLEGHRLCFRADTATTILIRIGAA